ncbi:uncharacterized protein LOC106879769 [Octopus bimaculoides]|uniref:Apple domain-containing protein n=1 Tax=Octopus bimaculoides TaxID=37653 RepID=A0A0L8G1Z8_OCTBM|nr:uncharacterized protein LOC106879769 [Octopus bimaculoides]|eukprot:XP_014784946.1 PREDICTED: uncharacterized protein LOC106879769 [Octopus bimaculoides]
MMFKVNEKGIKMLHTILIGCLTLTQVLGQLSEPMNDDKQIFDRDIFKNAFQSIVEINDENGKFSILEYEYNDPDNKRDAIIQFADKNTSRIIQYKDFKQVLFISDGKRQCKVSGISPINGTYPFGEINLSNKKFIYRSSSVMKLLANSRMFSSGKNIIRGIPVKTFVANIEWQSTKFKLTMNFAANEWINIGGVAGSPIRFTLEQTGVKQGLNHTYEYHSFFKSIQDNSETVFESPKGIVCPGRKSNMSLPDLPPTFSASIELTSDSQVKIIDVSYSKPDQLLRIDYQPGGNEDSPHPEFVNTISEIYDYNAGIRYLRNHVLGNCSTSKIKNSSLADEKQMLGEAPYEGYLIRSIMQSFIQKKDFEYVGLRTIRNIDCFVFAAHKKQFMLEDGSPESATCEIYLSSNDWTVLPDKSGQATVNYPVMVNLDTADISYQLSFIDFSGQQKETDVSSCYEASKKMHISILLSGNYIKSTKEVIETLGKAMIRKLLSIDALQIQNVQLSYDANLMYLYASILDNTPEGTKSQGSTLRTAFQTLSSAIAQREFIFTVSVGNIKAEYIGLHVRLDAGKLYKAKLPNFDDNFRYQSEIVTPSKNNIELVKIFYDRSKNLSRFDVNQNHCANLCSGPSDVIQDFTRGVSYVIDKFNGSCQIQPLFQAFDVSQSRMESGAQLFYFDKTYKYVGQQHVRGMLTNIFESYVASFQNNLFRFYFLDEGWSGSPFSVPVKLEIVSDGSNFYRTDNYFEFLDDILMSAFDISSCYRENNKITDLQITFKGAYKLRSVNFIIAAVNKIIDFTHLPLINIQNPELSYDEDKTYFRFSLIDPSPQPIELFTVKSNLKPNPNLKAKTQLKIQTPNECASSCIKNNCKAFTYCKGRKVCQLFTESPTNNQDSDDCNIYTKTKEQKSNSLSSDQVLRDLNSLIHSGTFEISFTVDTEQHFTAVSMLSNIDRSNSKSVSSVQNMKMFTKLSKSGTLKSSGPFFKQVSVDDCANLCINNEMLNCEAFTYCYLKGICFLSDIHPNDTNVQPMDACNIFQRNYANMFDQIPGKTFPMKGNVLSVIVQSADVCAKSCIDKGLKSCQSFEYCPSKEMCTLSSRHVMDVPSTDIITTEICNLYTVSPLQHFVHSTTKMEKLNSNLLVKNISLKACAKLCMEDEGYGCISFNYCPVTSICQITGANQKTINIEANIVANCSHYIRLDPPSPVASKMIEKSGNKGKLITLGFGTFIIGCLLGLITIFLIHKNACTVKDDPMKVNFYKLDKI